MLTAKQGQGLNPIQKVQGQEQLVLVQGEVHEKLVLVQGQEPLDHVQDEHDDHQGGGHAAHCAGFLFSALHPLLPEQPCPATSSLHE